MAPGAGHPCKTPLPYGHHHQTGKVSPLAWNGDDSTRTGPGRRLPQVDAVTVGDGPGGAVGYVGGLLEGEFFPTDCYLIAGTKTAIQRMTVNA